MRSLKLKWMRLLPVALLVAFSACTRDKNNSPASVAAEMTTITGSVFASSVSGAAVSVKTPDGRTIAGPATSAGDGSYRIEVPTDSLSSDLTFESDQGNFMDEASGTLTTAGKMGAYVSGGSLQSGSAVNITPASTIRYGLLTKHGLTPDNADTAFRSAFGYTDDIAVAPKNAPLTDTDADTLARLAFLRAAAFSQLTEDLGLAPDQQFLLLAAIAEDLADGRLDGEDDSGLVTVNSICLEDIQCKYASALATVQHDTAANKTCLNPAQIGSIPFGKTVLTGAYKIEYVPGMMPAAMGKTLFKLKVTQRSDGAPASGLAITLMPKMYMATKNHSTPFEPVTEEASNPGVYDCTVYYLMASGPGMGYWELKVIIGGGMGGETGIFYPEVGMAMGAATVRATLKGRTDSIAGSPAVQRPYFLFNDNGMTTASFNIFLAARESMMSHPAISAGVTLHDAAGAAWTVSSIVLSASTDMATWIDATDMTGGHWTISGLSGLTAGVLDTIFVKLTVNGEQKTTDGMAPSGLNDYASFTVTP